MEKVIIIGIGRVYERRKELIEKNYKIEYLAANDKPKESKEYPFIYVNEIKNEDFDKIIICSVYYKDIMSQLLKLDIDINRCISYKEFDNMCDKEKYAKDKIAYIKSYSNEGVGNFEFCEENEYPIIDEWRTDNGGGVDGHYFLQDILVANYIWKNKPKMHYDIGSRIEGFISHLIAMGIPTTIIDIRPMNWNMNCTELLFPEYIQADATELSEIPDNSIKSLSTLHAVEHFGLGRYGDHVDCNAWYTVIKNLQRVLAKDGKLYFSLPVGKNEKVCFNAHRVFSPNTIIKSFDLLKLEKMFLIHEFSVYEYSYLEITEMKYMNIIGEYDCGIFIMTK